MANKITYASAIATIVEFAKANGFDNKEVIEKMEKLYAQKLSKGNTGKKSAARKANEELAEKVATRMRAMNVDTIRAAWVRDNVDGINTVPKAVAVLNVAVDLGVLQSEAVQKTPTRKELVFHLAE